MADPEEQRLKLRETLEKACKSENYDRILKVADKLLAVAPDDDDARRSKAVSLAKKDRCADALEFCGDDELLADIKGYCQYRLGDLEGALATARASPGGGSPEAAAHVEAQTLYKKGDFAGAAEIYRGLLESDAKRSAADRRTSAGVDDSAFATSVFGRFLRRWTAGGPFAGRVAAPPRLPTRRFFRGGGPNAV